MQTQLLTLGSLFSGIGGFELGFERTGKIKTLYQVEIDAYCRHVLAKHWPTVQRFADIRDVGKENLPYADILCGGFPCQDISNAGKRAGIDGERSGLWSEYARIIRELRPRYVVVENVAALLGRGMERVLGDLAACGYDAEWQSIRASDVGAPHRRERIWIVAYPEYGIVSERARDSWRKDRQWPPGKFGTSGEALAYPSRIFKGWQEQWAFRERIGQSCESNIPYSDRGSAGRVANSRPEYSQWIIEPDVGRVAYGVPARVDRLRGLGNAIVPQIAEWIGHRIVADAFPLVTSHQSPIMGVSALPSSVQA